MDGEDHRPSPAARERPALEPVSLDLRTRSTELRSLTNDCSLRWFLDQSVPEDEGPLVSYFQMGTSIHEWIEWMIKDGDLPLEDAIEEAKHDFDMVLAQSKEVFWSGSRPDRDSVHDAIDHCLRSWWKLAHPESEKQHPFFKACDYPPKTEVYMEDTEHHIFSTADALYDFNDGITETVAIIDWKSGMGRKADPLQLWFYYYIGRKQGHIPEAAPFVGVFAHLTHGTLQWADPYPGDSYMDALLKRARWIKTEGAFIPESGWYCKYCPWQETHCPLFTDRELKEVLSNYSVVIE